MLKVQEKVKAFNEKKNKMTCDFCDEENIILVEKPLSSIVNGELFVNIRPNPLWICLDCLTKEMENY
jgi:hypothetical protein